MEPNNGPVCWRCLHWHGRVAYYYRTVSDGWCVLHNKARVEIDTCASWESMGPEPEPERSRDDEGK